MLQAYSSNITIEANSPIPFNNVIIDKGRAETLTAPASIEINQRGVYLIKVNGFGTGADAGDETIQLYVNGTPLPQAQCQFTTAAADVANFEFNTLLQVSTNNCPCNCYTQPTILQVWSGTEQLTDAFANIIVTKLC